MSQLIYGPSLEFALSNSTLVSVSSSDYGIRRQIPSYTLDKSESLLDIKISHFSTIIAGHKDIHINKVQKRKTPTQNIP